MQNSRFIGFLAALVAIFLLSGVIADKAGAGICTTPPCVDSADIIDGQVKTPDIANKSVTSAKLAKKIGIGTTSPWGKLTVRPISDILGEKFAVGLSSTSRGNLVIEPLTGTNEGFTTLSWNGYNDGSEKQIDTSHSRWRLGVDQRGTSDYFFIDWGMLAEGWWSGTPFAVTTVGVGLGTTNPRATLDVTGYSFIYNSCDWSYMGAGYGVIKFKDNPLGGCGDIAYLAYRGSGLGGESTVLEIANKNDADDHIALMPSGNVGIGTTAPTEALHVIGSIKIEGGWDSVLHSGNPSSGTYYDLIGTYEGWGDGSIFIGGYNAYNSSRNTIDVRIGGAYGALPLYASGYNTWSTKQEKKNINKLTIEDYDEVLKKIKNLDVVNFQYKSESDDRRPHIGIIAEESPREILDIEGKAVNLSDYTSFLLAGIKAQQARLEVQQAEIEALRGQMEEMKEMKAELSKLQALLNNIIAQRLTASVNEYAIIYGR